MIKFYKEKVKEKHIDVIQLFQCTIFLTTRKKTLRNHIIAA